MATFAELLWDVLAFNRGVGVGVAGWLLVVVCCSYATFLFADLLTRD